MENNILKYEDFLLEEYYRYIDSITLNESIGDDVSGYLRKVFDKIKNLSIEKKKNLLVYALSSLLLFTNVDKITHVLNTDKVIKNELVKTPELDKVVKEKLSPFKDPTKMKVSHKGFEHIKQVEGDPAHPGEPVLKAYKLGDGMITVGWGHAQKIKQSKFRVGQHITREMAEKLLHKDVEVASDGVRRMFQDWKDEGVDIKITQDQFNALVSMALNMGVSGLRNSHVVDAIKSGNLKKAGETIKTTSVSKKFGGLEKRREKESEMFMTAYLSPSQLRTGV